MRVMDQGPAKQAAPLLAGGKGPVRPIRERLDSQHVEDRLRPLAVYRLDPRAQPIVEADAGE